MHVRLKSLVSWVLAGASAGACALDLEASGEGKACARDGRCAAGYVCGADSRCISAKPAIDSGTAGQGGSGGGAELDAVAAAGSSSSKPSPDAAGEASSPVESGLLDQGSCEPRSYFADDDGDGFGRADSTRFACSRPSSGWTMEDGDCDDTNEAVFPGQASYFGSPYPSPGGDSFDYDCSGSEDPDQAGAERAPDCAALGVLDCRGSGFAGTGRTGSGVNPICGSQQRVECAAALLGCGPTLSNTAPARCR